MTWSVLYIDDEPDLREITEMALGLDDELEVRTYGSGEEGLAAIREQRPDLLLLDYMMPVMDGPATFTALRTFEPDLPVVFLTARVSENDVRGLMALGAAGVIAKPFDPMTLAEEVKGYLPR